MMVSNISVGVQVRVDKINSAWRKAATAYIDLGEYLIECKKAVPHGDWADLLSKLDFDKRTAQRLMEIARDKRLSNPSISTLLPKAWTELHRLTKLSDNELEQELAGDRAAKKLRAPKPKITDAVYHEVEESTVERPGITVSADSIGDSVPPVADAVNATPQDDREGGDSVVTEHGHSGERSLPTERSEPERLFDPASGTPQSADVGGWDSYNREFKAWEKPERAAADDLEANARLTAAAEPQGEPDRAFQDDPVDGAAGESPAIYSDLRDDGLRPAGGERSALQVRASQPARFLATGLTMAIRASKEVSPAAAAEGFPQELTPSADDVTALLQWMYRFEKLFRDRYGIAIRAAE